MPIDCNQSLQQLEGKDWGEPTWDSHLVTECHRLRRIPLREFTAENLRIMIGQQIGLRFLVPLALELLRVDPLIAGDFYEGDLLAAVLTVEAGFWREHPGLRREAAGIAERALFQLQCLDDCDRRTTLEALSDALRVFQASQS